MSVCQPHNDFPAHHRQNGAPLLTGPAQTVLKNPETNPYPHKFQVTYDDSKFVEEFGHLKSGETAENKEIRIAGRIYNKRASGSKLIFYGNKPQTQGPCQSMPPKLTRPPFQTKNRPPHIRRHGQHRHAAASRLPGAAGQGGLGGAVVREAAREHPARRRHRHRRLCGAHQPQEPPRRGQGGRAVHLCHRDCAAEPLSAYAAECAFSVFGWGAEVCFSFFLGGGVVVVVVDECVVGTDAGGRARMRYLDMLWNDKSREVLWQRSRAVRYIRECKSVVSAMRRVDY